MSLFVYLPWFSNFAARLILELPRTEKFQQSRIRGSSGFLTAPLWHVNFRSASLTASQFSHLNEIRQDALIEPISVLGSSFGPWLGKIWECPSSDSLYVPQVLYSLGNCWFKQEQSASDRDSTIFLYRRGLHVST
jgi:hypothetical protein